MGGTLAFGAACGLGDRIAASACYYGGRIQTLLPMAAGIKGPVRVFYGGLDTFIPPEEVEAVRSGLAALDLDAEVVLYPDADHGFCNEARAEVYDGDAADDSWARTLEMFGRALAA